MYFSFLNNFKYTEKKISCLWYYDRKKGEKPANQLNNRGFITISLFSRFSGGIPRVPCLQQL